MFLFLVYLRTNPEVVFERIQARAREEESCVSLEYLKKLHELHEDWLFNRTQFICPAPVSSYSVNYLTLSLTVFPGQHTLYQFQSKICEPIHNYP